MGNAFGINSVGYCYHKGIGVKKNEKKAFEYSKQSIEMGIRIEKDGKKAFEYFKKSAEMGNAERIINVGKYYEVEIGAEKDERRHSNIIKICRDSTVKGINCVEYCYLEGIGIKKDEKKAFEMERRNSNIIKYAEMGLAEGINNVGKCLEGIGVENYRKEAFEKGIGVEKDGKKAFEYYKKSAEMGNTERINKVGYCYLKGIGIKKDEKKASRYYKKSAKIDNAVGMNYFYMTKESESERMKRSNQSQKKALKYYKRSAKMGDALE
ncbi:hypothetical protein C2G38_2195854 [Gigaspora rosea]|uniref:Uncharacterized protein n=1 Tax=Gigaspora rosea TaxID=44941 RepID=A0A397UXS7_9GLOM|nr:hypothetical protein C2G38_2195854 [Gigaspora rosea]